MSRHGRTKLVPLKPEPEINQALQTIADCSQSEQIQEPVLTELDSEMECPRCHDVMELQSSFDKLMYWCEGCSFIMKCV